MIVKKSLDKGKCEIQDPSIELLAQLISDLIAMNRAKIQSATRIQKEARGTTKKLESILRKLRVLVRSPSKDDRDRIGSQLSVEYQDVIVELEDSIVSIEDDLRLMLNLRNQCKLAENFNFKF